MIPDISETKQKLMRYPISPRSSRSEKRRRGKTGDAKNSDSKFVCISSACVFTGNDFARTYNIKSPSPPTSLVGGWEG